MLTNYDSWKTRTPDEGIEEYCPTEAELDALDEAAFEEKAFRVKRDLIVETLRLTLHPVPPPEQLLNAATTVLLVLGEEVA